MSTKTDGGDPESGWVTAKEAARRLGTHPHAIVRLERAGLVGVRRLPTIAPAYRAADIETLMRRSTKAADPAALARWASACDPAPGDVRDLAGRSTSRPGVEPVAGGA